MFFGKEQAAENGGIDFEIRDIGTSVHWYWRLKNFMQSLSAFYYLFGNKNIGFKRPVLLSIYYWIFLICLATVQNWGKHTH